MRPMRSFSGTEPIVGGATLVEASAGTGKTYNLANLFVRLVAERALPVEKILVVTFTTAATSELRARVRLRLGEARRAVAAARGGSETRPEDDVLAALATGEPEELAARERRLTAAEEDFDLASISTIHGFCQRALQLHAFESDLPIDRELATDTGDLLEEIVDDYLTREVGALDDSRYSIVTRGCGLRRDALLDLARTATAAMDSPMEPPATDWRADLTRWLAQVEAFQARWAAGGRSQVCAAIGAALQAKVLNGRVYQTKRTEQYASEIDAWLAAPVPAFDPKKSWWRYFTRSQLRENAPAGSPPEHDLFAEWERVIALDWLDGPRVAFAEYARSELGKRLAQRSEQSFDDLLRSVSHRLADPEAGEPLARAIRERFSAALIDEFQDTDETQWAIFETIFLPKEHRGRREPTSGAPLYLIGDPKQAIYSFRGADVFVYKRAKEAIVPDRRFTMRTNHRSSGPYVAAMNSLFGGRPGLFEQDAIDYVEVDAAKRNLDAGLRFEPERAPLQLRWFDARSLGREIGATSKLTKGDAGRLLPSLVAADVVELLHAGGQICEQGIWRAIAARDLAVLVRKNAQAAAVHAALLRRNVPAILSQTGSVFESDEAAMLEGWLAALAAPERLSSVRALATTPLFFFRATELLDTGKSGSSRLDALASKVAGWSASLDTWGFAATFYRMLDEEGVFRRLLALSDGERRVTNLRHLGELLHLAEVTNRLATPALLRWLQVQRGQSVPATDADALRLESDADAVKVVTLHASKGLEYPIVFLPTLWDGAGLSAKARPNLRFHDDTEGGGLTLDLRLDSKSEPKRSHVLRAECEALQENLRLLYVGFTRARHYAIAYAGPVTEYDTSPLGIVLHGDGAAPGEPRSAAAARRVQAALEGSDQPLRDDLAALAAKSASDGHATIETSLCAPPGDDCFDAAAANAAVGFAVRTFAERRLEDAWGRLSFTALTRGKELAREGRDWDDEGDFGEEVASDAALSPAAIALPSAAGDAVPLDELARGATIGKFVHKVLEQLDFATGRDKSARRRPLLELVAALGPRMGVVDAETQELLARHLPAVLATPLGPEVGGLSLDRLSPDDRLDELTFDFPLAGGDDFHPGSTPVDGREFLRIIASRTPDDVMRGPYLDALGTLDMGAFAGFMTGSIDLVFRVHTSAGPRWFIADYKTNRLGPPPGRLPSASRLAHYAHGPMRAAMEHANYFLQYHLYLVALHRYLETRVVDYDYETHVGGAFYLFVRGMTGKDAPTVGGRPAGVFFDDPPARVIRALSALFDRAEAR